MSCLHLEQYKTDNGLDNYDTIYSSFILPSISPDPSYVQASVSCFECENYNNDRLMACMYCIYFGCYENHFSHHASSKAHGIFVEIPSGNIFCVLCQDFAYDADVDEIVKKYDKFNKGQYVSWKPTELECKLLKEHGKRVKVDPTSSTGMRGIINLGNSCFMSCILQALLHTPMLRDYFFTDRHNCQAKKSTECLFCLISRIYQRYYADDDFTTLSLHDILCLVWKNDPNLYGNNQKDAHEFFISARNSLHQVSAQQHNHPQGSCNCIIDSIFHGNLQSDVVCQNCSNVSTKIDPLWEISLDIPEPPSEGGLIECLYHFTRPEPLGSNGKINCTSCNSYQEGTKQLTFKLLPLIIVIQLKRFQHVDSKYKKKCLYVPFPIDLDMSPFLTGKRNEKDIAGNPSASVESDDLGDNRYSLYAVIVHKGTLSGGHYVAYIRRTKNKWFNCNDLAVVPVEIEEVLASEGYLLFYHKTVLPYE